MYNAKAEYTTDTSGAQMVNQLMNFRLQYLRAIATAWSDKNFENILINHENKSNPPDILDQDIQNKHKELKNFFKDVQLKHVSIKIFDDDNDPTEWKDEDALGWTGSDDYFIIWLPNDPTVQLEELIENKDNYRAHFLAEYYAKFPTLFGSPNCNEPFKVPKKNLATASNTNTWNTMINNSFMQSGNGSSPIDLGVSPEPFLEFGGVTLRALALAWNNSTFSDELQNMEFKIGKGKQFKIPREDATPVLSKYLGYNNPWNFNMQFQFYDPFKKDEKGNLIGAEIPKNVIMLHYPRNPAGRDDTKNIILPMALASYNESGPAYPFTCN